MIAASAFPFRGDLYPRSGLSNPLNDYIGCLDAHAKSHGKGSEEKLTLLAKATAIVDSMNTEELATVLGMLLSSPGKGSSEDMEFFVNTISGLFRFQDKDGSKLVELYQEHMGDKNFAELTASSPERTSNTLRTLSQKLGIDFETVKDRISIEVRCTLLGEKESDILSGEKVVAYVPRREKEKKNLESW